LEPKNILVIDCETTGNASPLQIVELCLQKGLEQDAPQWTRRVRPDRCTVTAEAQAIHGISMDDLRCEPTFQVLLPEIWEQLNWAHVIVGYNVEFDLNAIEEEIKACLRIDNLNLRERRLVVDPYRLWQRMEPRGLEHAHKRFVGSPFSGAHGASADVAATARVLVGMVDHFSLEDHNWEELQALSSPEKKSHWIGPTHHVQWNGQGAVVFGFGKYQGCPLGEFRSYMKWCLNQNFPAHVVQIFEKALLCAPDDLARWCKENFK
jgi:DNA polymerase-3 subunit epsilon